MDRLPIDWLLLGIDWLLLSIARLLLGIDWLLLGIYWLLLGIDWLLLLSISRMTELANLLVLTKLVYRRVLLHLRIHWLPVWLHKPDLAPFM